MPLPERALSAHQLHHASIEHNLQLVLVLPSAQHEVARLQVAVDDWVWLPARSVEAPRLGGMPTTCCDTQRGTARPGDDTGQVAGSPMRLPVMQVCQAARCIQRNLDNSSNGKDLRSPEGVCQRPAAHELCDKNVGLLLRTGAQEL